MAKPPPPLPPAAEPLSDFAIVKPLRLMQFISLPDDLAPIVVDFVFGKKFTTSYA
jgi:hypothetical protein